jgi:hypothetical protein
MICQIEAKLNDFWFWIKYRLFNAHLSKLIDEKPRGMSVSQWIKLSGWTEADLTQNEREFWAELDKLIKQEKN